MIPTWTYWLMGFVAFAAAAARLIHYWSAGRSVASPFLESRKRDEIARRMLGAQQRFREGADPTWEDDLNDALHSPPTDFEENGPEMIYPGMEKMPETWDER